MAHPSPHHHQHHHHHHHNRHSQSRSDLVSGVAQHATGFATEFESPPSIYGRALGSLLREAASAARGRKGHRNLRREGGMEGWRKG